MRKVNNGRKRRKKGGNKTGKKEEIMTENVATNVIANQPPERRPTGTLTTRPNYFKIIHTYIAVIITKN